MLAINGLKKLVSESIETSTRVETCSWSQIFDFWMNNYFDAKELIRLIVTNGREARIVHRGWRSKVRSYMLVGGGLPLFKRFKHY